MLLRPCQCGGPWALSSSLGLQGFPMWYSGPRGTRDQAQVGHMLCTSLTTYHSPAPSRRASEGSSHIVLSLHAPPMGCVLVFLFRLVIFHLSVMLVGETFLVAKAEVTAMIYVSSLVDGGSQHPTLHGLGVKR